MKRYLTQREVDRCEQAKEQLFILYGGEKPGRSFGRRDYSSLPT